MEANRFLVVVAHADDEVLGCGGTIHRLVKEGKEVNVFILCTPTYDARQKAVSIQQGREQRNEAWKILGYMDLNQGHFALKDNQFDKTALLHITQYVEHAIAKYNPQIVLTHTHKDLNIDHQITNHAVRIACRPFTSDCGGIGVSTFEVPSSTECNRIEPFKPNYYVRLSSNDLQAKVRALQAYRTEERDFPHPRSEEYLKALATVRGVESGWRYAEGFELIYGVAE